MSNPSEKKIFWIDLEMTGLDEKADSLLEVAIVITNMDLQPLESFHRIFFQPPEILAKMNDWCKKTHGESGLTAKIPQGMPGEIIEKQILELIDKHFSAQERIVLAGNSVGNDRRFIQYHMPQLAKRLHYRIIDVSSFKEVFREKYHLIFEKKNTHRATEDIYESIRELSFYLAHVHLPKETFQGLPMGTGKPRPSFQRIYLDLAFTLAKRSTCQRLQVGTVISSTDFRKVLAVGYNGNATGLHNGCDRDEPGNCGCLHSEENAVINCDAPRMIEKLVFVTHLPCLQCAKRLINLGNVKTVYYGEDYRIRDSIELLESVGIPVVQLKK